MELSLKRAFDYEKAALEAANDIKPARAIRISVYGNTDPEVLITAAKVTLADQILAIVDLIDVSHNIRSIIGQTNQAVGITALMRQSGAIEVKMKKLSGIVQTLKPNENSSYSRLGIIADDFVGDINAVKDRISLVRDRIKNKEQASNLEESFQVIIAEDVVIRKMEEEVRSLRRQKATISDKIAGLNSNTLVTFPDEIVTILKKYKVL